jgi:hypothetical protein
MAAGLDTAGRERLARTTGLTALSAADGMRLFDLALAADRAVIVPARLGVPRVAAAELPAPLRGLVRPSMRRSPDAGEATLRDRLMGRPADDQEAALAALVVDVAIATLGYRGPVALGGHRSFKDLGFDSLTAVDMRNRLNRATGLRMPATVVFDHPTPTALARWLHTELCGGSTAPPAVDPVTGDEERLIDDMDVAGLIRLASEGGSLAA